MARKVLSKSWLGRFAETLKDRGQSPKRPVHRRLGAELLEGRMVLSGAPLESVDGGESLAEYVAREQEMGPIVPAELAASHDSEGPAAGFNDYLGVELPEGEGCVELPEGCGTGGGEGSGSGGGGTTTYTGEISLDGMVGELSTSVSGGSGSLSVDADGNYVFQLDNPTEDATITITITDSEGNTSTATIVYDV